ncbi:PAP2-domain-containing protein [Annulohypoxylon maeteangense]|uniref:PAP2-domain-containing protein n=1 Tax=Annulohypoxylon maeteangense TaxID=1927788 RepID=UPI002007BBF3|nr:PAP2-domain-containing protein [Annulohypoxylon maeteangense]KAI0885124.1 PAP2-domain-containing protein [Annulohypoxylon maeteangense]
MADEPVLASLSLTHVHYDPSDPISYLCAFLALVPQGLCVMYATLIWSTREIEIALLFAGQLACEAINFILKRLIKEERPRRMNGKGYGMPSSHAQFVAYFAVSVALFLLLRHRPPSPRVLRRNHTPMSMLERAAWCAVVAGMAAAVAWSRIYLNYHTEKQVLVGWAAGTVSAVGWFVITTVVRRSGWLAWGLETPVAKFFRIRDLVVEEDLCQAGWEKWDDKMTALKAKKKNK